MRILAIDYGKRKTGLALATSAIAEPLFVIRHDNESELLAKLDRAIQQEEIDEIVLGISSGKMGKQQERFGELLKTKFKLPVHFQDESLTTKLSQELSIEAGIKQKKRKLKEDAYSAAIILQRYLDRG